MSIRLVDHINVHTEKLEETRRFYVDVLGLTEGWRPPFSFDGYWFYAGDRAVVHIQRALGPVAPSKGAALNHGAFEVADMDGLLRRLDEQGVSYRAGVVVGTDIRQAFVEDPNGVRLEFNFRPSKA